MNYDVGIGWCPVTDANTSDGLNSTWVVDQNPTLDLTIAYDKIASGTLQISQIESDLTSSNVHGITLENGGSTSAGQRVQLRLADGAVGRVRAADGQRASTGAAPL